MEAFLSDEEKGSDPVAADTLYPQEEPEMIGLYKRHVADREHKDVQALPVPGVVSRNGRTVIWQPGYRGSSMQSGFANLGEWSANRR
jgi:hypothetical protein